MQGTANINIGQFTKIKLTNKSQWNLYQNKD